MNTGTQPPVGPAPWWRRHRAALVIFGVIVALGIDAAWIEPYRIQVTHYTIHAGSEGIQTPLKIAQLSDLHTRGLGRRERKMLAILAAEKPDVILITGDTLADPFGDYAACMEVYKQIHAPLGVWFVHGNWENLEPMKRERQYYREAAVNLLVNQNHELRPGVWLIGLDDFSFGRPEFNAASRSIPRGAYTIAMFHSPVYLDQISGKVNLCLAGHTHGGQVRLPFIHPFWLPYGSGRFLEGWYEEKGTRMYVSRGVGMSNIPVRFLCRPEIDFVTLEP
ncbi:MAG TPA: metallophosphoesterase [Candidatus Acidoferrales bacterium]|nr:metallophosphoesterase [Candidatus Acidoferrales bacterium]HEV2340518.1 metallophosphoesterase [Candidatus Acidoferrales bacterium]